MQQQPEAQIAIHGQVTKKQTTLGNHMMQLPNANEWNEGGQEIIVTVRNVSNNLASSFR